MTFAVPPALRPGDWVAVVAPASPFDAGELWRGMAWLRGRYRIKASSRLFARDGYLAGTDEARVRELATALTDPAVKAVLIARGGYGIMRIVDALPWEAIERRPAWVVGFSDTTALHACLTSRRIASVHGPNVTGLSHAEPIERAAWLAALERPQAEFEWIHLEVVHKGTARGPLVGGNLALLEGMASAGRLDWPKGAILALEDVTEKPYRIDRMLTSLRLGGYLDGLGGIVFGSFTRCEAGADGTTVESVLRERTLELGIPVLAGAPFGHGTRNLAFVTGQEARLDGGRLLVGVASR